MSLENTTEDGDKTLFLEQETSEVNSPLKTFSHITNVLLVDPNPTSLRDMKEIMEQYTYQVTAYADAKEAISFLTNCKHEINIVIWDYRMPEINGLQALEIIGSKMDLPVVIMSDDQQTKSVMDAILHGACHYVMKPIRKEIIATIWQHIVRKRVMSKPSLIPPVVIHDDCLKQEKDDSVTVEQDRSEQNINEIEEKTTKKQRMTVKSNSSDQDDEDSRTISQDNFEQSIDKKDERHFKKPRISWTGDLQQKFLDAIDFIGGPRKANPKTLLKCLQDMQIEGLTRSIVASHLQKYRLTLVGNPIDQQYREPSWSSLCKPSHFLGVRNGFIAPSPLVNGPAVYPVQDNQYQNGYLAMNNNQLMTNNMPDLPYLNHDHHLQQPQQHQQRQHQLANQVNYMMRKNEPEQAYNGIGLADLESIYPSLLYDPNEFAFDGYNFNN